MTVLPYPQIFQSSNLGTNSREEVCKYSNLSWWSLTSRASRSARQDHLLSYKHILGFLTKGV